MRELLIARDPQIADVIDRTQRAASFFVDSTGEMIGDFLQDEEGIGYAEFDLTGCVEPKQFHDVVGYYNFFDVFSLMVNRKRQNPITFVDMKSTLSRAMTRPGKGPIVRISPTLAHSDPDPAECRTNIAGGWLGSAGLTSAKRQLRSHHSSECLAQFVPLQADTKQQR